jgi:fatty-acyl-CoA synthase
VKFNLGTLLTRRAQYDPGKPAVISEGQIYSFRELNERCNRWANSLVDLGLKKGDRVGILLPNRNEFLEALFGIVKIGGVVVPLSSRLAPPEIMHAFKDCGIHSLIFDIDLSEIVETMKGGIEVSEYIAVGSETPGWTKDITFVDRHQSSEPLVEAGGEDPAVILYTSGTTGRPKGVVRHHASYLWVSMGLTSTLEFRRVIALAVPLYYGWGLNFAVTAVHRGDTAVLLKAFDARRVLHLIRDENVDTLLAVGTMLERMTHVPHFDEYLSSLHTIETTETLPPQLREKYSRQMIRRTYGLAETGFVSVATASDLLKRPDSEGFPLLCTEVRIVGRNGVVVPNGEIGEIVVKSPTMMREYWADAEATRQVVRDGWFHTGDLGRLDEYGRLYLVGRIKDAIRSGGELVSPGVVEKALYQHPNILEAVVIGRPDPVWGERVCAIVRPKMGAPVTAKDIIASCQEKLAHFEVPKEIILTDEALPRDPLSGKLIRKVLQDRFNLKASASRAD